MICVKYVCLSYCFVSVQTASSSLRAASAASSASLRRTSARATARSCAERLRYGMAAAKLFLLV